VRSSFENDERVIPDESLAGATAVRRAVTALAARARVERRGKLSINQVAVLGILTRVGPMTPTELSERLHTSPQALTRTIAALEDEGMIGRAADPSDGRQSILSVSRDGREALAGDMRPRDRWLAATMESELNETERALLVLASGLMERLAGVDAAPAPVEP
jgi:DNA-binding MarR family transcriptional regulator